jgi:outer membrane protein TolC
MAPVGTPLIRYIAVTAFTATAVEARADDSLPEPLRVDDVVGFAATRRPEILAARAGARAAAQRPAIVSALAEPTLSGSIDHVPFSGMGADWSVVIEQSFPLSRIRGNRERRARAEHRRDAATIEAVTLDVELDAARAYWMLAEARATAEIARRQHALATQLAAAATARYAANLGAQPDVLRAEMEVARLAAEQRATAAEVRAAEVMLNTSLARDVASPIPVLDPSVRDLAPAPGEAVARAAGGLPELRAGRAEIDAAEAEVRVMRSMYAPMAMVRTGPAYTMAEGRGWMVMVGVSIPLWRGKLRAGVDEARAMVEMSTADLDGMRRMAVGRALAARERVIAVRERFDALRDDIVPRAEQAIEPMLAAYAAGQVPLVSVVEVAQALWMAERELVMAHAALGIAWAELGRATGEEVSP